MAWPSSLGTTPLTYCGMGQRSIRPLDGSSRFTVLPTMSHHHSVCVASSQNGVSPSWSRSGRSTISYAAMGFGPPAALSSLGARATADRMIRLFVPDALVAGASLTLPAEQAHYLVHVMRLVVGGEVHLFNGCDGEWRATLVATGKRSAALSVGAQARPMRLPPDLDLIVALVKRSRLETIVEKAAELGARRVRLATTRRTNAAHTNVARLQAIAVEAAEQTGRLDVPQVLDPEPLERLLDDWAPPRRLMFCDEAGDDPRARWGGETGRAGPAIRVLADQRREAPWAVLIGPEGGFDPTERERLRSLPFVASVTLGPRILRADTAAICALTLWQAALGDWDTLATTG